MKLESIAFILPALICCGCASNPKGASTVKAEKGNPGSISYVTADEMAEGLRKKIKDDLDLQIELKMVPKGGRLIYEAHHYKISLEEQDNTLPFISVVQNGKEVRFCDDSEFKSRDESVGMSVNGSGVGLPLKDNKVKITCDIKQNLSGEFEVLIQDQDRKTVEKYVLNTKGSR